MKTAVTTLAAAKAGTVDLADHIFGLEPRADILHRMVTWQLARRRAGTHKVKNRSDIAATGAKMYRQKGTGRARHGDKKVPQFRGGGRAFGPHPRDHSTDLPKKVRALALRHALSAKARSEQVMVLDDARLETPRTSALAAAFAKLGLGSALIVDGDQVEENFARAARNLPRIDFLPAAGINVYDILNHDTLVLTRAALARLEERFHA
jgi:large subunit ribosomal protein L4